VLDCRHSQSYDSILPVHNQEVFLDSATLARHIVDIVEDKQATDIVLLDIHEQTTLADYFVIATIDNERQARAISNELLERLKLEEQIRPLSVEGTIDRSSGWALLDYGDVIVHLFSEEAREFYRLEALWSKGNVVLKVI
jgi:ribosome-associated protein